MILQDIELLFDDSVTVPPVFAWMRYTGAFYLTLMHPDPRRPLDMFKVGPWLSFKEAQMSRVTSSFGCRHT